MRKTIIFILGLFICSNIKAQIPNGYYNNALGLNGATLKTALHNIIKGHTSILYSDMDIYFVNTDKKPNGKVWDMYSFVFSGTQPYEYSFGINECGNYNSEGDCFNKEHSWPQSYFNENTPMKSDFHHIFPTDGWVNGKHSNLPYGNVTTANWTSQNGCQLGTTNSYTNFSSTNTNHYVFEPLDSFKGDFARAYFYMTTRYESEDAGWGNWEMANGAELTPEAIILLMQWHHNDPVSTKEKNRNEAVFAIQNNRNPFVDYPEFADCIWGAGNCSYLNNSSLSINSTIDIFPNPSNNLLNIKTNSKILNVKVYDPIGKLILQTTNSTVNISELSIGNYFVVTSTENGNAINKFYKN